MDAWARIHQPVGVGDDNSQDVLIVLREALACWRASDAFAGTRGRRDIWRGLRAAGLRVQAEQIERGEPVE